MVELWGSREFKDTRNSRGVAEVQVRGWPGGLRVAGEILGGQERVGQQGVFRAMRA